MHTKQKWTAHLFLFIIILSFIFGQGYEKKYIIYDHQEEWYNEVLFLT